MTVATGVITRLDDGSVTVARGFRAGAVAAGLKVSGRLDLGLLVSEAPCVAAATFTQNAFPAAPVILSKEHLRTSDGKAQAIVFNSGNANACTGEGGLEAAREMTRLAANQLGIPPELILAASTGIIGNPLPIEKIRRGLPLVELSASGGHDASRGIMTTDTVPKEVGVSFAIQGKEVRIGAMCKGVGMIHPNMATMLAFLATDAALEPGYAGAVLKRVVDRTFNMVTVDGDTSTNDSCFLLANGLAGTELIRIDTPEAALFAEALEIVCTDLARKMARDGEGATKLVQVDITGARSAQDARAAARAVVLSSLVKSAIYGQDPNWGRILAAVGNSLATVDPRRAALWIGAVQVAKDGLSTGVSKELARSQMLGDEVQLHVDLGLGDESARAWGCDLTEQYVLENSAYST